MGWPEALVAVASLAQLSFLAWIAHKQQQVKRDLQIYNGRTERKIDAVAPAVVAEVVPAVEHVEQKIDAVRAPIIEAAYQRGLERGRQIAREQE